MSNSIVTSSGIAAVKPQNTISVKEIVEETEGLPLELFRTAFAYLDTDCLRCVAEMGPTMQDYVVTKLNIIEPISIQDFIQSLIENLNAEKFSWQTNLLVKMGKSATSQKFTDFCMLEGYILDIQQQLIDILETLDPSTITLLKNQIRPPHFMEDIFVLSEFERQIDQALDIEDWSQKNWSLKTIATGLADAGHIDRTLEVVRMIPDQDIRNQVFLKLLQDLIKAGRVDEAIKIVETISDANSLIGVWTSAFITSIDKAVEIIQMISDESTRNRLYKRFSEKVLACNLTGEGRLLDKMAKAVKIAQMISDVGLKNDALLTIGKSIIGSLTFSGIRLWTPTSIGLLDKAVEITQMISDESTRNNLYKVFSKKVAACIVSSSRDAADRIAKALEIAQMISDADMEKAALLDVLLNAKASGIEFSRH